MGESNYVVLQSDFVAFRDTLPHSVEIGHPSFLGLVTRERQKMEIPRVSALPLVAYWATMWTGAPVATAQQVGEVFQDCEVCPRMVVVPAGRFIRSSPETEEGRRDSEGPRRVVSIESFAVGVYEVTFEEWDACAWAGGCGGAIPEDEGWGRADRPVIHVDWEDAQAYVSWLSKTTGQEYRLLSEAEWEYVARAGTETARYWGESETAQCRYANGDDDDLSCSDGYENTAPVGSFQPNGFGLHDVLGNVWEWTEDCWVEDYSDAANDGSAKRSDSDDCSSRVMRGGSWGNSASFLRSANRGWPLPGRENHPRIGFRVARSVP